MKPAVHMMCGNFRALCDAAALRYSARTAVMGLHVAEVSCAGCIAVLDAMSGAGVKVKSDARWISPHPVSKRAPSGFIMWSGTKRPTVRRMLHLGVYQPAELVNVLSLRSVLAKLDEIHAAMGVA